MTASPRCNRHCQWIRPPFQWQLKDCLAWFSHLSALKNGLLRAMVHPCCICGSYGLALSLGFSDILVLHGDNGCFVAFLHRDGVVVRSLYLRSESFHLLLFVIHDADRVIKCAIILFLQFLRSFYVRNFYSRSLFVCLLARFNRLKGFRHIFVPINDILQLGVIK